MNNKDFYIAAYNSGVAGNAGAFGRDAADTKRSLQFSRADYSSEEDSPYAPAMRKARALERRRNGMASEEVAKSNLLFQKMGITRGGDDSDDDDEEEDEVVATATMQAVEEQAEQQLDVPQIAPSVNEIEALKAFHQEELSAAKHEVAVLSKQLAAAVVDTETISTEFQVFQAKQVEMEDMVRTYEDQIAHSKRLLEDKSSFEQTSVTEVTVLKTKTELLERQVATLQASGERAEAERSTLAAENAELNDKLKETLGVLANTKQSTQAANDSSNLAAKQLAQQREEALRTELRNLQEELAIVQNALMASNEAVEAATQRATEALKREEEARQNAATAEEERHRADKVADEALVEAEYLRGEVAKLENKVSIALTDKAAAVEAAAAVVKAQHATEFSRLVSKLQLVESEKARLLEESELHEKQAREIHTMVVEEARLSALQEAEIAKLQADKASFKEQAETACARNAALEAQLMTTQQELDTQISDLIGKMNLVQQQHDVASQKSASSASQHVEEIEMLKQKLVTMESEASETAAAHALVVFEANKRIKDAETRCEMVEKQNAAATRALPLPVDERNFVGGAAGGRSNLVERKRSEFSDVDLEAGGTTTYDSDSSHDGEERGPLTALALRFGAWELAVNTAKRGDRATFAARSLLHRQQNAVRVLSAVYLLVLHVLILTGRMCSAI